MKDMGNTDEKRLDQIRENFYNEYANYAPDAAIDAMMMDIEFLMERIKFLQEEKEFSF